MDLHDPAGWITEEENDRPSQMGGVSCPSPPFTDPGDPLSSMLSSFPLWDDDFLADFSAEYFACEQTTTCSIPAGVLTAQHQHQQPVDNGVGGSRENKDPSPLGEEIQACSPSEFLKSCDGNIFAGGVSRGRTDANHAAVAPVITQGGNHECAQDVTQQQIHTMLEDALTLPSESSINAGGITMPPREDLLVRTKLRMVKVWGLLPQKHNDELVSLQKMLERLCSAQSSCFEEQYVQFSGDHRSHDGFGEQRPKRRIWKRTSGWMYFSFIPDGSRGTAVCHNCKEALMAGEHGTAHLRRHTKMCLAFKETLWSSSSQAHQYQIRETVKNPMVLTNNKGIESENERVDLGNKDVEVEAGDTKRKRTEDAEAKSGLMLRQGTDDMSIKRSKDHPGDMSTKGTEDLNVEPGDLSTKGTEDVNADPGHMSRKRKNCTPRKKSEAWDHFTPVMAEDSRVVKAAKCNHCQKELKMDKNATTSTLLRHVWDVHGEKLSKSYKFQMRPSKKKKQEEASTHNQGLDQADAESPGVPHEVHNN
ncbi:hypothetical protein ACP70R_045432 [Stipagrostis hirtigluma subsp. patula]